jgi:hypothetical protein
MIGETMGISQTAVGSRIGKGMSGAARPGASALAPRLQPMAWPSSSTWLDFCPASSQYSPAIYVLVCLLATCPPRGRQIQVTHFAQVVRCRARFARVFVIQEARHGYRQSKVF